MSSLGFAVAQVSLAATAVLLCLAAATQWAAAMLAFQPALGTPLIDLLGLKLYAPWKLFSWWLAFDAQAPQVFARAGAAAAFGGILAGAVAVGGAAWRASRKQDVTTYGSARWADVSDVRNAGLLDNDGVVLGLYANRYLRHHGQEHVLAVAPTRSGKGVGLVLPTLMTWTGSAVIHDIKGENWQLTAGWRSKFSHCLLFDPTIPYRPASTRCSRYDAATRKCGTYRTSPTSSSTRRVRGSGVTTGKRRPRPAHWRHPARAVRRGGEDAGAGRLVPRRSLALDPAHAQDHADHQPLGHRGSAARLIPSWPRPHASSSTSRRTSARASCRRP